jgi:hypothetical protein
MTARRVATWPVYLLALPAAVSIWAGWVGLGGLTGFGEVNLLPGIWDGARINTAITLPIGMEAYAAYALRVWLAPGVPRKAREFARGSALAAFVLGALGQIAFHLMQAAHVTSAPWPVTTIVACLPVGVLGLGATLAHLLNDGYEDQERHEVQARKAAAAAAVAPAPAPVPQFRTGGFQPIPPASGAGRFQAVPNLTTAHGPNQPTSATPARPDPAPAGHPDTAPAGRPAEHPAPRPGEHSASRPDTTPVGRPEPTAAGRPVERSAVRPDSPPPRPASGRGRKRARKPRTDDQLAEKVRDLAERNGGEPPSQYQVRQALGVGGGRAARLVAEYQPPAATASSSNGSAAPKEGSQ